MSIPSTRRKCSASARLRRIYEFGIKVSVATTAHRSKGGQFVTHIAALPGNPYDGHTLATVIPAMEDMIGNTRAPTRRCWLSRPQCANRLQVQGLYVRPEAPAHTADQ